MEKIFDSLPEILKIVGSNPVSLIALIFILLAVLASILFKESRDLRGWSAFLALVAFAVFVVVTVNKPTNAPTISQTSSPSAVPSLGSPPSPTVANQDQTVWECRAENTSLYLVDQLNENSDEFDVAIYDNAGKEDEAITGNQGDYFGTVPIKITERAGQIEGSGRLGSRSINVTALGRTPAFSVEDSVAGQAIGRCFINTDVTSSENKELVRNCLNSVEKKLGSVPEVARFGCQTDPEGYVKKL
ncbi:hypothetical protein H6F90_02670 [Trichocoleus sp. FACHB-591]|uniref:hypothetical protein n=1 Tax=Trichocoleus sp. FACHB-591 TaxID=2692872 RepID=UPI001689F56F|nr:hypothetical protein [Trichocoleus sp. FACHB-591]MBD2094058.1 hypothetical protein [Trichocoleus sp. FACHB-591]